MIIKGGLQGQPGNPNDLSDEGVFISKINPDGIASKDPRLRVGQRIIEVNGLSLLGATHQEAVGALRSAGDNLHVLLCDGFTEVGSEGIQVATKILSCCCTCNINFLHFLFYFFQEKQETESVKESRSSQVFESHREIEITSDDEETEDERPASRTSRISVQDKVFTF